MTSTLFLSTLLFSIACKLVNAFDPNSNENVVLYWGQNSASTQQRLSYYCENDVADILVLSFMSSFPGTDNKPSLNFANACWDSENGVLHCTTIAEDIKTCQDKGKIVLLSMGGAVGSYGFSSVDEAESFAGTVWDMFGEGNGDIRPFDDSLIDGFDLDLENKRPDYYSNFVTKLREYYATGTKSYYVSAAPQCVLPDASVNEAMINSDIDFAFIQFYNNYCKLGSEFNFNDWVNWATQDSYNKNIKLYVGLPGSSAAAGSGYASPDIVKTYIDEISCESNFGGISIWDASQAYSNVQNGKNFAESAKDILSSQSCSGTSKTLQASSSSSSLSSSSSSTTFSTAFISDTTTLSEITSSETASLAIPSATTSSEIKPSATTTFSVIVTTFSSSSTSKVLEISSPSDLTSSTLQETTDISSSDLQTSSKTSHSSTETIEKTTITLQPEGSTSEMVSQASTISTNASLDKEISSGDSFDTTSTSMAEKTGSSETFASLTMTISNIENSVPADTQATSSSIFTEISSTIELSITEVTYYLSTTINQGETQTFTITEEEVITTYTTIYYDPESISPTSTVDMVSSSATENSTATSIQTAPASDYIHTAIPTASSTSIENDDTAESCTDGSWQCGNDGTIQHCNFGKWVSFKCATDTVCSKYKFNGVDIVGCVFA